MQMTATPPQTDRRDPAAVIAGLVERLGAVTDALSTAVAAASPGEVGMPAAGAVLAVSDRLVCAVVDLLGLVTRRGVIATEGLSIESWLRTLAGRTVADEKMLVNTVERLRDLPTVHAWFRAGTITWPVVRGIVDAVRNLTRAQRRWVDETLAANPDRLVGLDADDVVAVVHALADAARPDLRAARDRRERQRREYLRMQPDFDGWTTGQFQFSPETSDVIRRALDTLQPPESSNSNEPDEPGDQGEPGEPAPADTAPGDGSASGNDASAGSHGGDATAGQADDGDDGDGGDEVLGADGWRRRRDATNVAALRALCQQRLGGPGGSAPSTAQPALLVVADLATLTGDASNIQRRATAELLTRFGRTARLTPQAVQRLACDATTRMVFTHHGDILGVSDPDAKVSVALRAALITRDGRCRFPGCRAPADTCDNHHVIPKIRGGATRLDNLALLCTAHHHAIHDSGWQATLHPDATMTFTRRGVTLTSQPHHRRHVTTAQPPPPGRPTRHHMRQARSRGDLDHAGDSTAPINATAATATVGQANGPPDHLPF